MHSRLLFLYSDRSWKPFPARFVFYGKSVVFHGIAWIWRYLLRRRFRKPAVPIFTY